MAREKKRNEKNDFLSGVLVLTLSAIIVKIIGLVYKIPMLRLLGSEGMGYFNSAYEIYALFCAIATTGLPVAMSVMISSSGDLSEVKRIFKVAIRLFFCLGIVGCGMMIAFARPFASFLGNEKAAYCIAAIAPTVFFVCLSSAYRGFFQGLKKMTPTAISQIIEALGKLILGLLFGLTALNFGFATEVVAAFAVMGLVLGVALSLLYLFLSKRLIASRLDLTDNANEKKGIGARLLKIAIPVTLSSSVVSVTRVIDLSIILRRLRDLGVSSERAFGAYGNYTTLCIPLFSLMPTLVSSVALPLVPSLSKAIAEGDRAAQKKIAESSLRLTALISAPASLGLAIFSKPILELIFAGEDAAISEAYPLLTVLSFSVMASCFITVGNAMLQAFGKAHIPLVSMAVGTALKIVAVWFLMGDERIGLLGAPLGTLICDLVINLINFCYIGRMLPPIRILSRVLLRPFLSAAVSVSLARLLYNVLFFKLGESKAVTLCAIALAFISYILLAFLSGAVLKEDIPFDISLFKNKMNKSENN